MSRWMEIRGCPLPGLAMDLSLLCCGGVAGVSLVHPSYWVEADSHGSLFGCDKMGLQRCLTWGRSSEVDPVWVAILWEHLPQCFVLLIGCCLFRDLVLIVFLPPNVLPGSQSVPSFFFGKPLQCAQLCVEHYYLQLLAAFSGKAFCFSWCGGRAAVCIPASWMTASALLLSSSFCWFLSLYWQLCS